MINHRHACLALALCCLGGCTSPRNTRDQTTRLSRPPMNVQMEPFSDSSYVSRPRGRAPTPLPDPAIQVNLPEPPPLQRLPEVAQDSTTHMSLSDLADSVAAEGGYHAQLVPEYPRTEAAPLAMAAADSPAGQGADLAADVSLETRDPLGATAVAASPTESNSDQERTPPTPQWFEQSAPNWLERMAAAGFRQRNHSRQLTTSDARPTFDDQESSDPPFAEPNALASHSSAERPDGAEEFNPAADASTQVAQARAEFPDGASSSPSLAVYAAHADAASEPTPDAALAAHPSGAATSDTALTAGQDDDWRAAAAEAVARLDRAMENDSHSKAERLRMDAIQRMLRVVLDASPTAPSSSTAQQRYWTRLSEALQLSLAAPVLVGDSEACLGAWLRLQEAARELSELSPLRVGRLTFCQRVDGYGQVTPYSEDVFYPDQEVLLYVEVEHFLNHPTAEGVFETELQGRYQICDDSGRRLAEQAFLIDKQQSRNRRRDYFVPYRLYMPREISPGHYTLTLNIRDLKGDKSAEASVPLTIAGPDLATMPPSSP